MALNSSDLFYFAVTGATLPKVTLLTASNIPKNTKEYNTSLKNVYL